jgi:predicted phage terminase large subunit-like protein
MVAKHQNPNQIIIQPQPGAQTAFLASRADIAIYGGAAGSGKSAALVMQPLLHHQNPNFGATIFRTHSTDFRKQGGLWQESFKFYTDFNARPRESFLDWIFPSGATVKLAGLTDKDMHSWQSTQIPLIEYEELTHHSDNLFWYMLSRNRSTCGVRPYIRAACNPQYGSWVGKLIEWWIDDAGFPIKDRSGILRWFIRLKNQIYWGNTREELINEFGDDILPKSITFIPASIYDNKILMQSDPGYLSNLKSLNEVDQMQLLYGNWKTRPVPGTYFKKTWVEIVDCAPAEMVDRARGWDRAATEPNPLNPNPDWTAGVKIEKCSNNYGWVTAVERMRGTPFNVESVIKNTASHDGKNTKVVLTQDPGGAGKTEVDAMTRKLGGYVVIVVKEVNNKLTNFKPFSSYAQAGNIKIVRKSPKDDQWIEEFINELEAFTGEDDNIDDQVDAASKAFNSLFDDSDPRTRFL